MKFEWDQKKNKTNLLKHGVNFEEAITVFDDIFAVIIEDIYHSSFEQREIIVGQSSEYRLLYVVFVEKNNKIRIISARLLMSSERKRYEQGRFN
jgi:uncharacterized protein